MLDIPIDIAQMQKAVLDTCRANGIVDGYIRLVVTRGTGDLGLDPKKCPKATIFIIADKINLYPEKYYTDGLETVIVSTKRSIPEALNPCIKSLNYLNNILAKIEAARSGYLEAIMLNAQGYVAECTGDNIFIIRNNVLITPPTWAGALEGVTRNTVMDLARKSGIEVRESLFTSYDIYTAQECFLTGTAAEIIPVVKVDLRPIGSGKPGATTQGLIKQFREYARTSGVAI